MNEYDVIMTVSTSSLTEDAYKVGNFAGDVELLIEVQEDGVMGPQLVAEGTTLPVCHAGCRLVTVSTPASGWCAGGRAV